MRRKRAADADVTFTAPEAEVKRVRSFVMWEAHLLALLLLFASFMARAIGS
jgi:uncharacterized membrane protein